MHNLVSILLAILLAPITATAAMNCQSDLASAVLGATLTQSGADFALWAPNAQNVEVLCESNWAKPIKLHKDEASGIWRGTGPQVRHGNKYKFKILDAKGTVQYRNDPHARYIVRDEKSGNWDSVVWNAKSYIWKTKNFKPSPKLRIMEVNPRTRVPGNLDANFRELAHHLIPILKKSSINTVSLMPVSHHNVVESWGYQPGGIFAVNFRHGNPDDLKYFVDLMHRNQITVFFDIVIGHASKDWDTGLGGLDGKQLYFNEAPHLGEHAEWGTYIYDFSRPQVRDFLISNVLYWAREFKIDGIRMDGVTSMLHLDYSRSEQEKALIWKEFGTNINKDALGFLKDLNRAVKNEFPNFISIAEESSGWPAVTKPVDQGGLGFDYMWGMGGMHHMRTFLKRDPGQRDLTEITAPDSWGENYITYVNSHDELAHGKTRFIEMINGAQGSEQKFEMARLVTTWMYVMRGHPMLFQGDEIADVRGWNQNLDVQESLVAYEPHRKFQRFVHDLGLLHAKENAFDRRDPESLKFINVDNTNKVLTTARLGNNAKDSLIVIMNFGDQNFPEYRIPALTNGRWEVIFNSNDDDYGKEAASPVTVDVAASNSMVIRNVPARAALILKRSE